MKLLAILAYLGIAPATAIFAQATSGASSSDLAPWLTAGAVLSVSGLFYKFMRDQLTRLQTERDALNDELRQRNKEDRELLIPNLIRNTEALTRVLSGRGEKDGT